MRTWPERLLVAAGLGVSAEVVLYIVMLLGGADWIVFIGSPGSVVGALAMASVLTICAFYAFSGAGLIGRLPLLRGVIGGIGAIFTARGLIVVPSLYAGQVEWNSAISVITLASSLFSLLLGVAYAVGAVGLSTSYSAR